MRLRCTAELLACLLASTSCALAQKAGSSPQPSQPQPVSASGTLRLLSASEADIDTQAPNGTHTTLVVVIDPSTEDGGVHQGDAVIVVYRPGKPSNLALSITKESSDQDGQSSSVAGRATVAKPQSTSFTTKPSDQGIHTGPVGGTSQLAAPQSTPVESASSTTFGPSVTVTIQRKLSALVRLPGNSINVVVQGSNSAGDVSNELQGLLETELFKDDSALRFEPNHADSTITVAITGLNQPEPTIMTRHSIGTIVSQNQSITRITGSLAATFQVKNAEGQQLIADNVDSTYDREFNLTANSPSHGLTGSLSGLGGFGKLPRGSNEDTNPPTNTELRSKLLLDAAHQIAEHIVDTRESFSVRLSDKRALDEGDKQAEAGLWQRALETFETAPTASNPGEDAYRLYNIGVAYEALAYQADDDKAAVKYLDQAAINYRKAIDAKPSELYFVDPKKRIETAITHYQELNQERKPEAATNIAAPPEESGAPATVAVGPVALTNNQVIAMIKAGLDDDTVIQAVHAAGAVEFDLTPAGQVQLSADGVSPGVLRAMKDRTVQSSASH